MQITLFFELLFRDFNKIEMPHERKDFIKSRLKDSAFIWFQSCNYNSEINLTKNEQLALNDLRNNTNIVIQKFDKGNSVALLDKDKISWREYPKYQATTPSLKCFNLIMIRNVLCFKLRENIINVLKI